MSAFDSNDTDSLPVKPRSCRFRAIVGMSSMRREAAIVALRMIEHRRWCHRLIRDGELRSDNVLRLVGLEDFCTGEPIKVGELRSAFADQLGRMETHRRPTSDALGRNILKLGAILKLTATERAVLRVAVVITRSGAFSDLFENVAARQKDLMLALADAGGLQPRHVIVALSEDRMLRCGGFLENDPATDQNFGGTLFDVESRWANALVAPRLDEQRILRRLLRIAPPPSLALEAFAHVERAAAIRVWLHDALARRRRGVNILLYGAPGTGKTEFARTCVTALGATLFEVPNEDHDGSPIAGRGRFGAYALCQKLLAHGRKQILLFDEVEDVFGGGAQDGMHAAMFGRGLVRDPESLRKSWINETLETNPAPAIWICNAIDGMDPAFLRRFDLVAEFRVPGRAVRRRMIDRYFNDGTISDRCADRLAGIAALAPAQVERASRVARSLRVRDQGQRDAEVEGIVQASLRAMGHERALPMPVLPDYYEPAFLNADRDLDALVRGLQRQPRARICLHGVPGTGKTAFAHHLGRVLDRPVLVRCASDLIGMYCGQTEKNIKAAFEQARDDDAILVIDEADSFLRDRSGARQSWEVSQVNELLTQMEAFDGLFVASTNLVDTLDAASLRRFDFKIRFDYLTRQQRRAMLARVCAGHDERAGDMQSAQVQIDRLEQLTPGDFANVLRQLRVTDEKPSAVLLAQLLAAEVAMKPEARHRRIGFCIDG